MAVWKKFLLEGDSIPATSITAGTMQSGSYQIDSLSVNLLHLANESWIAARNGAGSADVNVLKVTSGDRIEIGQGESVGLGCDPSAKLQIPADDARQELIVGDACAVANDATVRAVFANADGPTYLRMADSDTSFGFFGWYRANSGASDGQEHLRIQGYKNYSTGVAADVCLQPMNAGNVLIGIDKVGSSRQAQARLHVGYTDGGATEQLRLEYDETHFAGFTVDSAGSLAVSAPLKVNAINERTAGAGVTIGSLVLKNSTFSGVYPSFSLGLATGSIGEYVPNSGVTIDSLLVKDSTITLLPTASPPTLATGKIYVDTAGVPYIGVP